MVDAIGIPSLPADGVARRLWSRDEYERLVDAGVLGVQDRVELIAGEIWSMTPQNGPHAMAVGLGQDALLGVLGDAFHLRVQLPLALGADSEPEPDLAVIRGRRRDQPAGRHPEHAALVIEVSDSTLVFDRLHKASLYARARIPEFWIVNLIDRTLEVYRAPAHDAGALHGFAYRSRSTHGPDDRVSPLALPDTAIRVADLLP